MASAASPSTPTQGNASVTFLTLPPEIRSMIYAELLRPNAPVFVKEIEGKHSIFPFQCTEQNLDEPWTIAGVRPAGHITNWGPTLEALSDLMGERAEHSNPPSTPQTIVRWYDDKTVENPGPGDDEKLWLAIAGVCRQTYEETAKMVYDRKFVFQNTRVMFTFISALELWTRSYLSDLEFRSWVQPCPAFSLLVGLENLKSVKAACGFNPAELLPYGLPRLPHNMTSVSESLRNVIIDHVAFKVYGNCKHWLQHLFAKGGIAAITRVFYVPITIGTIEIPPDQVRENEERFWQYLDLILAAKLR